MKLAFFPGCMISTQQYAYEMSVKEVAKRLGIEIVDLQGFSCCGQPMRHINLSVSLYLGLRNLAVASSQGLDVLAPCPMCHLALMEAKNAAAKNPALKAQMERQLASEGLELKGGPKVLHTLDILYDNIDKIKGQVIRPVKKRVAAHYGCHTLRYSDAGRPDSAEDPHKMEDVLRAIGAFCGDYPERLNCCGGPWLANHPESGLTKTGQKLKAVSEHGFEALADVCPWGHKMFDTRQKDAATTVAASFDVPVFYLTQLVGYAMGLEPEKLGLMLNQSSVDKVTGGGK